MVGAGTAGIPAAIEAADRGARVVLIDKLPRVGGMLHVSTGQFSGAGTRRQRQRGIEDDSACHLADVERLSHGLANHAAAARHRVLQPGRRCAARPALRSSVPAGAIVQPPFYGLWSHAAMLMSREGLRVDADPRVVDDRGRAIRGLYAVGEVLGASQFMGDSFVSGMSVDPSITLGRLVGQRLAHAVAG